MGVLGRVHLSSCASRAHNYSSAAFDSDCGTPHAHTGLPTKLFSRIETELCANEIIVMIPLDVTELDTSSSEGIRGESRSLLANYTRRSLSLHHFPRRGPYHLLPDESDFHFCHSKDPCTHFAQTPSSQLQLCESCCKYACCCCWLLSKV